MVHRVGEWYFSHLGRLEVEYWDWGLEVRIGGWRLGLEAGDWDWSLEIGIGGWRLGLVVRDYSMEIAG